ncbi:uncharacterized protein J4E78_007466 [Alternaria triticimaculans]|uniref:uncharacterized protein n=1 Tax=Alternaria triticimaculans TaxID=297637 RepID=UPI0020C27C94|nr:uncharacterized protein J4E78_007466 [Alternaria triticimaculans]KAI4654420.1 hypothetical protein J4E78_007466 [Alternaria triticimaculans]
MADKCSPNDRTLNSRVSKTHITYLSVHTHREPHPAVRTTKKRDKTPRRIDVHPPPLTSSSSMHKHFDIRFARHKSTWRSIAHGFVEQQQEKLRDAEEDEMECEYDTMDQLAAFEASGGVFGSPPASAASSPSSSPSSDTTGSLAGSWSTASSFSASTLASSLASQPSVAAFNAATSSSSADNSGMSSPEVDMIDASDEYESHVAAAPTVVTTPTPAPPPSQPPHPVTTAPIAAVNPPLFSGLGYLPSKPLPTEKATIIAKLPSKPRLKTPSPSLPPKSASKPDVELGMGSFSASKITNSAALVSAFCNPHFKQFFSDEMKALQTCLLKKQKGICGSDLVYLNRSLKWVIDAAEAKWFHPDIDFESDDVADWRGKLNVFMEVLGGEVVGVAKDTKERIEKVFGLFADEEGVNEGFGEEAG